MSREPYSFSYGAALSQKWLDVVSSARKYITNKHGVQDADAWMPSWNQTVTRLTLYPPEHPSLVEVHQIIYPQATVGPYISGLCLCGREHRFYFDGTCRSGSRRPPEVMEQVKQASWLMWPEHAKRAGLHYPHLTPFDFKKEPSCP